MSTLTVGTGQQYATIAAAVAASHSGDVVNVSAGTYTNDVVTIRTNLTIQAVGGPVNLVETVPPPNGKAIITEGATGITVNLSGLTLSGAAVADGNGAGVRYEGGALVMTNMTVKNNQDGLLGAADSAGSISISNSTFTANGAGDGYTHNIYVGAVNSFTLTNSTVSDAVVGHDVKSRAANNTITGNTITDTAGSASYEIDLPNGGNATISNNTIEKGPKAQNPIAISYGEEGNLYASSSLKLSGNLLVNDDGSNLTTAVKNAASAVTASVTGNTFYGWNTLSTGPATLTGNTTATSEPALTKPGGSTGTGTGTPPVTTPVTTPPSSTDMITLHVSEDAWKGDAQFTVTVDGKQYGQTFTATASHAAGQSNTVSVLGSFGTGPHTVGVTFTNDAYGGTASTDRNLYVDSIVDGAGITQGASLLSNGTQSFLVGNPPVITVGSGAGKLVLQVSEDAWQGDAQFTVQVDGHQVGGLLATTALHAAGQTQEFDIRGAFAAGPHTVGVTFTNDAYGGSASTDRNLYVDAVGGTAVKDTLLSNGLHSYTTVLPAS